MLLKNWQNQKKKKKNHSYSLSHWIEFKDETLSKPSYSHI